MDIRNPDNTKNGMEKLASLLERFNAFSINTKKHPIANATKANNKYLNLNSFSEFIFLIRIGMLPKISPIKQKLVGVGKRSNKDFNIFPNKNTPTSPPRVMGNKYRKFFLKPLNKPNKESMSLSYIPNITQRTPLLIPGRIAPAPSNMPIKKFWIFFKRITIKIFM